MIRRDTQALAQPDISTASYISPEEGIAPHIRRLGLLITALLACAVLWAGVSEVNEIARVRGSIIPVGKELPVITLNGARVTSIPVKEGELIKAGDTLMTLDASPARSIFDQTHSKLISAKLEAERLLAFVEKRKPHFGQTGELYPTIRQAQEAALKAQIARQKAAEKSAMESLNENKASLAGSRSQLASLKKQIALSEDIVNMYKSLVDKGSVAQLQLTNAMHQLEALQKEKAARLATIQELTKHNALLVQEFAKIHFEAIERANTQRARLLANIDEYQHKLSSAEADIERYTLKSPSNGIVKVLHATRPGTQLRAGEIAVEIVPLDEGVRIETRVPQRDVGFVHAGLEAAVKVDAYDFSRFGSLKAIVDRVSPSAFIDEHGNTFYRAILRLVSNTSQTKRYFQLVPGMTLEADIATGKKTVLEYLLKPVYTNITTAFTER